MYRPHKQIGVYLGLILAIWRLTGCQQPHAPIPAPFVFHPPALLQPTINTQWKPLKRNYMASAGKNIAYIGPQTAFLTIPFELDQVSTRETEKAWRYEAPADSNLWIVVDTQQVLQERVRNFEFGMDGKVNQEIVWYQALPIFISNRSNDTVFIGQGMQASLLLEAMDQNGTWKPIEQFWGWQCHSGSRLHWLAPSEILITYHRVSMGSFHTQVRYRYFQIYSQPFWENIDSTAFNPNYVVPLDLAAHSYRSPATF